jgi:hypothetical protein
MRLRLLELVILVIMPWSFVSAQNRPITLPGNLFLPYKQNQKTAVFGKIIPRLDGNERFCRELPAGEQQLLWSSYASLERANLATRIVQQLGGPMRNVYFFTSRGGFVNRYNIFIMSYIPRREGLRYPINFGNNRLPAISFSLQIEKWPNIGQWLPQRHSNRAVSFGFDVDLGKVLSFH